MRCPNCGKELEEIIREQQETVVYIFTKGEDGETDITHDFHVEDFGKYVCGNCNKPLPCNEDEDLKLWFMNEEEFRELIRSGIREEPLFEEDDEDDE